jgi:3-deoxy-D-manno-octulosonic-acid transferase
MTPATIILNLYKVITGILHYGARYYLQYRLEKGKEHSERWQEKLVIYDQKIERELVKNKRGKEVIHIHAASSGEFNAIKQLLKRIDHPSRFLIVTTTTRNGQIAFDQYNHISRNIHHAFIPIDTPQAVNDFLRFWEPSALILVESEIWPNLITMSARKSLVCIINARMSYKSNTRWELLSSVIRKLLSNCCFIGASTKTDFNNYKKFHDNVFLTGNLKYDAELLPVNRVDLEALKKSIGQRKVFVCASTHPGEEEILIKVYKKLKESIPNLLMIIVPRHFERGQEIYNLCFKNQLISVLRSVKNDINNHIPADAQVYIANTMGELGLMFEISKIVFVGGSLVDVGGHNICEPAVFNCTVVVGKYTQNFLDIVEGMIASDGIIRVGEVEDFSKKILELFNNPERAKEIAVNGKMYVDSNKGAIDKTMELLEKYEIIRNNDSL